MRQSTSTAPSAVAAPADPSVAILDVTIPVLDEEDDLGPCVRQLHAHLSEHLPYPFAITIADNGSTDATLAVAQGLAQELAGVRVLRLDQRGRGRALAASWSSSPSPVLAYMDVDLSTDLAAVLPLVAPLVTGHSDIAIGTRLARGARVVRGIKREVISRGYNVILRGSLQVHFSDAQCGFKAIRRDVALELLPLVKDTAWFFDTELLVLAERAGLRIHEVPVDWVDDPDSRVDIAATAWADLRGVTRMVRDLGRGRIPLMDVRRALRQDPTPAAPASMLGQLLRFAAVGVASTAAYALLYLLLRDPVGPQAANLVALLVTAVANTAANRRVTFGIRGSSGAARHQGLGLVVFALGWALTAGSLAGLHALAPGSAHVREVVVLTGANLAATVLRFVLLRRWVFAPAARRGGGGGGARRTARTARTTVPTVAPSRTPSRVPSVAAPVAPTTAPTTGRPVAAVIRAGAPLTSEAVNR